MNVILFCQSEQAQLLPLTFLKPAGELRMGIFTFKERWKKLLKAKVSYFTEDYLADLFPLAVEDDNIFIQSCYFPSDEWVNEIKTIKRGQALFYEGNVVAYRGSLDDFQNQKWNEIIKISADLLHIQRPYDLFMNNDTALNFDFKLITKGRESQPISKTNGVIDSKNIFLEEGAKVEYAILNASKGPIYIGKHAEICEGSMVRGGLAMGEHSVLNLGTKIYGATTIGPWCKVGGEVNNSILTAYSNKGHDGFLGNSVIGEWCNLGADTNNSNLKNNYSNVKLWDYTTNHFEQTGLQFCGLMMGDHSKSAINTQFNTGTITGIFSNIFTFGFPPNKINSFTWGGSKDAPKFKLEAAYEVAERMMQRRNVKLSNEMKTLIEFWYQKEME